MELATKTHALLDYFIGILLLLLPLIPGVEPDRSAALIVMCTGLFMLSYNLATDYELGLLDVISIQSHLMLDFFAGTFLAFSPWLFGFADAIAVPLVILGVYHMVTSFITQIPSKI